MKPEEISKLKDTYNYWLKHDPTPAEQVGWSGITDQNGRFAQFVDLINNTSTQEHINILDVGCGDAALLSYLHMHLPDRKIHYTGIDINSNYTSRAAELYAGTLPVPQFIVGDFETDDLTMYYGEQLGTTQLTEFDYVLCSGTYNVNVFDNTERAYTVFFTALTRMISLARIAVGINFLSRKEAEGLLLTGQMFIYDKERILNWCREHNLKFEEREGYDPFDTTLFILVSDARQ